MKLSTLYIKFITLLLLSLLTGGQSVFARPFVKPIWQTDDKTKVKPLPPLHYIRSRDFDTKHIALNLRFNWEKEQTFGVEEFTFSPLKSDFKRLVLDAGYMTFNSIKLNGGSELKYKYDEKTSKLTIFLDRAYKYGENVTVVIDYQTKGGPAARSLGFGGGGGLTFIQPTKEDPNRPWQIWSQGESEYNKYWFPSFDYPNDFRTTEMKVTVKKPLRVIGNGKLLGVRNNGATRTFHWKMDSPYTNYLTSIVVGEYVEIKGKYQDIPVSTYMYKEWANEGAISVSRLPRMVKFYSEKLGVKYPYKKYAQTIAREFGGGMENITATTMTEGLIHDARTELDRDSDGLQAHELAHQWFGDYVTCRDWSEIWLNESFATYMDALFVLESKGKDAFLWENRGNQNAYYNAWRQGNRRPIVTKYYANPDAVFDTYAYPRGGAVLHMLRKQLGEANFWRALGHYLKSNANQPVSTEDLRIAIEEATGQSMDAFFDQWVYKMGHPVFEVSKSYDAAKKQLSMSVKQVQKKDMTSLFPQVKYFQTPVDIEIRTASGTRVETVFIKPQTENSFTFDVDSKPVLVDFDNEGTLIKELRFEKSVRELLFQLKNDRDVIGRNWAMNELVKIARKKETPAPEKAIVVTSVLEASKTDPFWRIRRAAIRNLRALVAPPANRTQAVDSPVKINATTTKRLIDSTRDAKSLVRAEAISFLGETKDPAHYAIYQRALTSDKSYTVIDRAAVAIAQTKNPGAYSVLRKLAQTASWKNRVQIAGLNGLAELGDQRALDLGFKYGADDSAPSSLRNAATGIVASAGKGDPRAYPLIFGNFKKAFDAGSFQAMFSNLNALIRLGDPRGQEAFDMLKKKYKDQSGLMGFILQTEKRFKDALK